MDTEEPHQEMSTEHTKAPARSAVSWTRLLGAGVIAGIVAAVANIVVWLVAKNAFDVPFLVVPAGSSDLQPITLGLIAGSSVLPAVVAAVLFGVLLRFTKGAQMIFITLSIIVLVLTLIMPLTQPTGVAVSTKVILVIMYAIVASIVVSVLVRTNSRTR